MAWRIRDSARIGLASALTLGSEVELFYCLHFRGYLSLPIELSLDKQVGSLFRLVSSLIEKASIRFGFKRESSISVTGTVPAMLSGSYPPQQTPCSHLSQWPGKFIEPLFIRYQNIYKARLDLSLRLAKPFAAKAISTHKDQKTAVAMELQHIAMMTNHIRRLPCSII